MPCDIRHDMHHVRVTLNNHFLGDFHATGLRHAPHIIAAQINQHQMLSQLFFISQQFMLKGDILLFCGTTRTRTGNRTHGN